MTSRRTASVTLLAAATVVLTGCGTASNRGAAPVDRLTPAPHTSGATAAAASTAATSTSAASGTAAATSGATSGATSTSTAGASRHAVVLLNAALHKVNRAGSAKVDGSATTTVAGQKISFKLAGVERWSAPLAARLTMSGLSLGGSSAGAMKMIMTPTAMYLNMPMLTAQTHKPWAELSFAALKKVSGVDISQLTQQAQQMQPAQYLQMLAGSGDVHVVGTTKIDGVTTQHYSGTIDLAKAVAALSPQLKATWATLGATGTEHLDVWIDAAGQVRRVSTVVTTPSLSMAMTLHLYAYGVKVTVTAPPASQTVDLATLLPTS